MELQGLLRGACAIFLDFLNHDFEDIHNSLYVKAQGVICPGGLQTVWLVMGGLRGRIGQRLGVVGALVREGGNALASSIQKITGGL